MSKFFDGIYHPDFCLASRAVINNIGNLVESGGVTEKFAEKVTFTLMEVQGLDARVPILHYQGVPMIPVDRDSLNNEIFAPDEGAGNNTSSIVAIRTNVDDGVVLLREYQDMFEIDEYVQDGNDIVEITGPNNIEARGPRCVARLANIIPV